MVTRVYTKFNSLGGPTEKQLKTKKHTGKL